MEIISMLSSEITKYALLLLICSWLVVFLVWYLIEPWPWSSSECCSSVSGILTGCMLYYSGPILNNGDILISVELI